MPSLEELKDRIEQEASDNPDKFFAVDTIREHGFTRGECSNCGRHFWATDKTRDVCGEPACGSGYTFINNPPTEKTFDFVSAWIEFAEFMEERGYKAISRYPVAARWRDDTEFVRASIYDFQPYVVSGEVEPPANPLVVPQFCVRFNDVDNVGITGRHYTGFIMTGQHAFTEPDEYRQERYFADMLDWITDGMGIPKEKIILHEDSWGGGGNLGACMEFFVDGLELFNQVYMFFKVDPNDSRGYSELDTKVLDMGMGHERIVWITHGSETSYEANMPDVVGRLYERTGVNPDKDIWRQFLPYSSLLNLDEVDDIDETWDHIANKIGIETDELKEEIMPAAALYSVADHARTLLVALVDGLLPSNTGEQHSLRVIARRALDFIDKYGWDLSLNEVVRWHADAMAGLFPELKDNVEQAVELIEHEEERYDQMREKAEQKVKDLDEDELDTDKLVELYDSDGISPELLQRLGLNVEAPSNFYAMVAERHEDGGQEHATGTEHQFDLQGVPKTKTLYYQDEKQREFEAEVVKLLQNDGKTYIALDQTCFYPTSGGQLHDTGTLDGAQVVNVIKQDGVILHQVEGWDPGRGGTVKGKIDWERRKQLMQHHSATHLINGATKKVIGGSHVTQTGAKKTTEKARLDITHYRKISRGERQAIQDQVNEWVRKKLPVEKQFISKAEAEQRYGFSIYQGGVPPGGTLRIVSIGDNVDVEACGGTHVDNTGEIGEIIVTNTSKVQDGVIRIEFKAGEAAQEYKEARQALRDELETWLDIDVYSLDDLSEIFQVPVDELSGVVERFIDEWQEQRDEVWELESQVGEPVEHEYDERPRDPEELFNEWKQQKKDIQRLEEQIEEGIKQEFVERDTDVVREEIPIDDIGTLIRIARHVTAEDKEKAVIVRGKNAVIASRGENSDHDLESEVEKQAEVVQGGGDFVKGFKLKK